MCIRNKMQLGQRDRHARLSTSQSFLETYEKNYIFTQIKLVLNIHTIC